MNFPGQIYFVHMLIGVRLLSDFQITFTICSLFCSVQIFVTAVQYVVLCKLMLSLCSLYYCLCGSGGLYWVRLSFFLSAYKITHELLLSLQPLEPY